jgi:type I restriction enzyme S subunit
VLGGGFAMKYSAYPAYKDSGVDWLGEIPEHWEVKRLKWVVSQIGSGKTPKGGGQIYRNSGVIFLRSQNIHFDGLRLEDVVYIDDVIDKEMASTRVRPQDVLLNITGASLGRCSIVPSDFPAANVNQHVCIIRPIHKSIQPSFLLSAIASNTIQAQIFSSENGTSREGLTFSQIANLVLAVPSNLSEQQAIASFLDRETAKIDALIAKKERLIELLQEKRTAIISHALTKGLDPTVPLRDSGVEWLGEVPAHWKVLSVRRLAGMIEQGWSPVAEDRLASEDEWGVIKLSAVNQGLFRPEEHKTLPEDMEADKRYEIKAGDFLLTRANTPNLVGDVCVVSNTRPHLMLSDLVYRVFVDDNRVSRKYLCYWFLCRAGRYQITRDARGSSLSMVKVSQNSIRSWLVALPPFLEQQAIASYLDHETAKIDALIAKIREGIEKLKEYRTGLISAAVTGKIDVRNEVAS